MSDIAGTPMVAPLGIAARPRVLDRGAYGLVQTACVFAALGAMIVRHEQIGPRTVLCGVIVLFGVWLATPAR